MLASDVLRGSRVDDARHLLDTATELLSGARRGARLVLSHPVSDAVSFAAKSSARGVKTELTHLDFVDDDDDFVDGEHGDVGADEGDDDALDAFVAAARARGFAVREWFPRRKPKAKSQNQNHFLPKSSRGCERSTCTFPARAPVRTWRGTSTSGAARGGARAGGGSRAEGSDAREVRAGLDAAPVAASSEDGAAGAVVVVDRDGGGGDGEVTGAGTGRAPGRIQSSPGKRKKGGFCVVSCVFAGVGASDFGPTFKKDSSSSRGRRRGTARRYPPFRPPPSRRRALRRSVPPPSA